MSRQQRQRHQKGMQRAEAVLDMRAKKREREKGGGGERRVSAVVLLFLRRNRRETGEKGERNVLNEMGCVDPMGGAECQDCAVEE